jgi:hypothetical protein
LDHVRSVRRRQTVRGDRPVRVERSSYPLVVEPADPLDAARPARVVVLSRPRVISA